MVTWRKACAVGRSGARRNHSNRSSSEIGTRAGILNREGGPASAPVNPDQGASDRRSSSRRVVVGANGRADPCQRGARTLPFAFGEVHRKGPVKPEQGMSRCNPLQCGSSWGRIHVSTHTIAGLEPCPRFARPPGSRQLLRQSTGLPPLTLASSHSRVRAPSTPNAKKLPEGSFLAGLTGLEPATSSVTGWHSNRLSYNPRVFNTR